MLLASQKAFRELHRLEFCYLCATTFSDDGRTRNKDHVPPSSIFRKVDRDFPLILPTHTKCNGDRSGHDEAIGQLVGLLHGDQPDPKTARFALAEGRFPDGTVGVGAAGLDLRAIIWRWVRGFHAALYREPLPSNVPSNVFPPLPEGRAVGTHVEPVPLPPIAREIAAEIRRNRATGTLDTILCRAGHCRYETVWVQSDRGHRVCMWALDLYGWHRLGEEQHFEQRGCMGAYWLPEHALPRGAACATNLVFRIEDTEPLNPFAGYPAAQQ